MASQFEQRSDSALFQAAQQCQGGIPEILEHFFGFLARRTDYFSGKQEEECRVNIMRAYEKQCDKLEQAAHYKRLLRDQEEIRERRELRQRLAMEKAKKEEEAKKALEEQTAATAVIWRSTSGTQTLDMIEITVPFNTDFALKSRDVIVDFQKTHLKVGLRGWDAVIDGDLAEEIVINDDTTWSLDNKKTVSIQLLKKRTGRFWSRLITTDPEINVKN
ncbi:CS domain-containing protein [Aphelenchoides bicaudatus]|nr:CS domain-containing protein [Aphelenchoides bicaudatus]